MKLSEVRSFAVAAHGEQRYGDEPYLVHLDAVAAMVASFGETAQQIAYLHDVLEDTDLEAKQLEEKYSRFVVDCVALLTDEPGGDRYERKIRTYARLSRVVGSHELALVVKAADRLANVRACIAGDRADLWRMYRDEHQIFRICAHRPGLCDPIWSELDMLLSECR